MKIYIGEDARESGYRAAKVTAENIKQAIRERGFCRLLLSTGASQFETLEALVKENVDWSKVAMFHLDEYIGMPITHIASFRRYLTERFVSIVHPAEVYFVNGEGDVEANIAELTKVVTKAPFDVSLVGIGENGHIAFNDPPADFDTHASYIVVNLDEKCRHQQMGEGWFKTLDEVPKKALSMSPWQIMQSRIIISVVCGKRKAQAVKNTLEATATTNLVPATLLKEHTNFLLFLDKDSASATDLIYLNHQI